MPFTVRSLVRAGSAILRAAGIEDARLEAELILSDTLDLPRSALRLDPWRVVDITAEGRYRRRLERRRLREPLQYVVGKAYFRDLSLHVDARVLIPRPETELLAGAVLDWSAAKGRAGAVLDVGTGSGAIAISLATEGGFARVVATDASEAALEVAHDNAARVPGCTIEFRQGSLFEPCGPDERFDVVVSNPPYVDRASAGELAPEVRDWEPPAALFAEAGGLAVLFGLVDGATTHLEAGGLLALEVGAGQAATVRARLDERGFERVSTMRDLAGIERIVLGERAGESMEVVR